jgi:hypothetical protein
LRDVAKYPRARPAGRTHEHADAPRRLFHAPAHDVETNGRQGEPDDQARPFADQVEPSRPPAIPGWPDCPDRPDHLLLRMRMRLCERVRICERVGTVGPVGTQLIDKRFSVPTLYEGRDTRASPPCIPVENDGASWSSSSWSDTFRPLSSCRGVGPLADVHVGATTQLSDALLAPSHLMHRLADARLLGA